MVNIVPITDNSIEQKIKHVAHLEQFKEKYNCIVLNNDNDNDVECTNYQPIMISQ